MTFIAQILVGIFAALHLGFLVVEMFLWDTPGGCARFGTTLEFGAESAFRLNSSMVGRVRE